MGNTGNPGTYTALQKLRPITTDFGDIVENAVDDELARKAKAKAEEAAKKKAKKDLANKFGDDYAALGEVVTKTKSIDEAFARGINSARDLMGDIYKNAENDPTVMNTMDWQMKKANLTNYSKNLKLVSDRYTEYASMVSKGMQDGELSNWNKDELNDLNSIFGQANLDVKVDNETGLPIAVIAKLDDDGEPTGELKELNLVEVLDGRGLNQAVNTFGFQKSVTDIGSKLGKREVKTPGSGLTHTEYQQFEDIEPEVRTMIKGFIGNDKNPTDIAKSIWSDQMAEDPKELDSNDMKRFSYSRASRKDKKEDGLGIQLRTDEDGRPDKIRLTGVGGDIRGDSFQFTIPEPIRLGIKGENREISNLFLTPEGKIAYQEVVYKGKASGEKINPNDVFSGTISGEYITSTQIGGGLNTTELNDIARQLGLRNARELKEQLTNATKEQGATPTQQNIDTSKYN